MEILVLHFIPYFILTVFFNGGHGVKTNIWINDSITELKSSNILKCGADLNESTKGQSQLHSRHRRATSIQLESRLLYIGFRVSVDRSMREFHGNKLESYIKAILGLTGQLFREHSVGQSIEIVFVDLNEIDINTNGMSIGRGVDAFALLSAFCNSSKRVQSNDTSIFFTRKVLCRNENDCDTMGLAHVGTICEPKTNCAIIRDFGTRTGFVLTHEVGHLLGMHHDNSDHCSPFQDKLNGSSDLSNIMNSHSGGGAHPRHWTKCSRHFLQLLLASNRGSCLETKRKGQLILGNDDAKIFQHTMSPFEQCQLSFTNDSLSQRSTVHKPCGQQFYCHKIHCISNNKDCRWRDEPWLDGTDCGSGQKCLRSQCVNMKKFKVVHGGWGPWILSNCSKPCGGGYRNLTRRCDRPLPENGGRFCLGQRLLFKSCNTFDCIWTKPIKSPVRSTQCSALNGKNLEQKEVPKGEIWLPFHFKSDSTYDPCQLYCRGQKSNYYWRKIKTVEDGTRCTDDPKDFSVCVNGLCLPAGCDNILYSKVEFDDCDVCGGLNSCENKIQKGFYNEMSSGLRPVVCIPPGSKSIKIRQEATFRDNNYLVLSVIKDRKNVTVLNEYSPHKPFESNDKVIQAGGIELDYSGCEVITETLNSSVNSPPTNGTLCVLIYSFPGARLSPPRISYEYYQIMYNNGGSLSSLTFILLIVIKLIIFFFV